MSTKEQLRGAATGQLAVSPLATLGNYLEKLKPQMKLALPKHMNADRMTRLALTAFSTNPALQQCTVQSIAGSLMTAAQLGLEPGVNGQGYLIPYKTTCTFVPGWKGLVDLVARAGRATVWTGVVFPGDEFEYQLGDAPFCRHRPGDAIDGDAEWTHVYAIGRVRDAVMPVIEVWTRAKVERHLQRYNKVGNRHYARANENNYEMFGRKVALLQVLKYMPQSVELSNAIAASNAAEEGKGVVIEGDFITVHGADPETGEIHPDKVAEQQAAEASNAKAKPEVEKPAGPSYAELASALHKAKSPEDADVVLDGARHLQKTQYDELVAIREGLSFE